MLTPIYRNKFKKEVELCKKRGKNTNKLRMIMSKLINQDTLEKKHLDHPLIGNHSGYRECHIENDWLLIYKLNKKEVIFCRTGTHSDLFK